MAARIQQAIHMENIANAQQTSGLQADIDIGEAAAAVGAPDPKPGPEGNIDIAEAAEAAEATAATGALDPTVTLQQVQRGTSVSRKNQEEKPKQSESGKS